jgi:hypothetical protein
MKSFLFLLSLFSLSLLSASCWDIQKGKPFQHIAPEYWRGVFVFDQEAPAKLMKIKKDSVRAERVPVSLFVDSDAQGLPQKLLFFNGQDTTSSDSLRFFGDTLFVYFNAQETYMRLVFEVNLMEGQLFDKNEKNYPIRFQAQAGKYPRYPDIRRAPTADVSGSWSAEVADIATDSFSTVPMLFKADKNAVSVAISASGFIPALYLEGTIQGKQLYLSGFDGKLAVQMVAELSADGRSMQKASLRLNDKLYSLIGQR